MCKISKLVGFCPYDCSIERVDCEKFEEKPAAEEPAFGKWTPVTKELPEEYTRVLVSVNEPHLSGVNSAMLIGGEWRLRREEEALTLPINAWMPLPEPYEGE